MSKSIEIIEADINLIKSSNSNWFTNAGDKALLTELYAEKKIIF
jgi:hypothetical protein